jgi:plastocyanin
MQTKLMNGVAAIFAVGVLVAIAYSAYGAFTGGSSAGIGSGKVESGSVTVATKGLAFRDGTRTVATGTTVSWKNLESAIHTVTATDKSFDSPELMQGQTYRHTFSSIGKYKYYCRIHSFMTGAITVVAPYGSG